MRVVMEAKREFGQVVERQNSLQLTTKVFTVAGFLEFHGEKLFSLRPRSSLLRLNEDAL